MSVTLGTLHTMHMHHIVCGLPGSTLPCEQHNKIKFKKKKKVIEPKMFVLIFPKTSDRDIYHSKKNRVRQIKNECRSGVMYPLFLYDLTETWIFSTDIQILLKYQISWQYIKLDPSCSTRTDRQTDGQTDRQTDRWTDMMKLIVAFCSFANMPIRL